MSGLRRRNVSPSEPEEENSTFLEKFRELDAFTKITEEAEAPKTSQGGFCTGIDVFFSKIESIQPFSDYVFRDVAPFAGRNDGLVYDDKDQIRIRRRFGLRVEDASQHGHYFQLSLSHDKRRYRRFFRRRMGLQLSNSRRRCRIRAFQRKSAGKSKVVEDEGIYDRSEYAVSFELWKEILTRVFRDQLLREGHDVQHLELSRTKNKKMMDQGMMHKVVQINLDPSEPQGCRVWGSIELQKIAGTIKISGGGMGGIPGLPGGLDAIMGMFMMPMMGMGAQIQDVRRNLHLHFCND